MSYEIYISNELLKTLQIPPEDFPGEYCGYNRFVDYHTYLLDDNDVELGKKIIKKNTGVERVDFDGECFVAYNASEDN